MIKNIFLKNLNELLKNEKDFKNKEENKQENRQENQDMSSNSTLDQIKELIKKSNKIIIFTHENPDGDAIGSSSGVYLALKLLGKDVRVYVKEVPKTYTFLESTKDFVNEIDQDEEYDLAISLDCSELKRLYGAEIFKNAKKSIQIDHHIGNQMFADVNFVDPRSPANAQIIASLLEYFNIEMTKDIATSLMTGIITDTGGFQYSSVQPETFEFAAELLKSGIDISDIYKKSIMTITKPQFELRRIAQDRLEFYNDGKIAFTYITKDDEQKANSNLGDTEGIVDIGRRIEGVELSIYFNVVEENEIKISFRSNNYVDVSTLASQFGGGGHLRAAGAKVNSNFDELKEKVLTSARKVI